MTTLFLCIQNAYVASLSALLVESVCTHLVYGSRQQYQLDCGVSTYEKLNYLDKNLAILNFSLKFNLHSIRLSSLDFGKELFKYVLRQHVFDLF